MDESLNTYYQLINQQQQANNAWSAEQAQKAMDYQTEMSNTAHQREVADLKAAGLNPVLSAGGQGATTGSGHAASAGDGNVNALYGLISKVVDAQLEQAKAMQTTAKVVGGSGSGSGSRSSGTSANYLESDDKLENGFTHVLQDILKRKFGISYSTSKEALENVKEFAAENKGSKYTYGKDGDKRHVDYEDYMDMSKENWERFKALFGNLFDSISARKKDSFSGSKGKF